MEVRLIAIGKASDWIKQGFQVYAKRLNSYCRFHLIEIPASKYHQAVLIKRDEGQRLLQAVPPASHIIALDIQGAHWSTAQLAQELQTWQLEKKVISLLIGGAEGLDTICLQRANQRWSLSQHTFPHLLARILVVEQLYRAWSILTHHPYHRA